MNRHEFLSAAAALTAGVFVGCSDDETTEDNAGSGGSGSSAGGSGSGASGAGNGGNGAGGPAGPGSGGSVGGSGSGGNVQVGSCLAALVVRGSNYAADPHEFTISIADFEAGVDKTFECTPGGGGHTHEITLTAADFAALIDGELVTKYSCRTPSGQSDHEWAISCANPSVAPVLEGEIGTEGNCPA